MSYADEIQPFFSESSRNRRQLFEFTLQQAVQSFSSSKYSGSVLGTIQLFNEQTNEITLECIYPNETTSVYKVGQRRFLDRSRGKIGVSGRAILERKPQLVTNTKSDQDYAGLNARTCSEIAVPLIDRERILGAISLQSDAEGDFDTENAMALQPLATLVVVIIKCEEYEERFQELKNIKGLVGGKTATDWMRMVSTAWGHAVRRESSLALNYLELIRHGLASGEDAQVQLDLSKLSAVVERIKDIPIVAPLAIEDMTTRIAVNDLLRKHMGRVWQHEPYRSTQLNWDLQPDLDDQASVLASPQWILQAVELLVDNAVQAMTEASSPRRDIAITTRLSGQAIEILIKDSGPGIPKHIRPETVGIEPVSKPGGSRGAGLGLVLARTIAQTYGGDLRVVRTGSDGTVIAISLPYERP